jgi:hypothetical protein
MYVFALIDTVALSLCLVLTESAHHPPHHNARIGSQSLETGPIRLLLVSHWTRSLWQQRRLHDAISDCICIRPCVHDKDDCRILQATTREVVCR